MNLRPTLSRFPFMALFALYVCAQAPRASAAAAPAGVPGTGVEPLATLTARFISVGLQDGWVLESSETSGKGGTKNYTQNAFPIGDDALNRQYRSILSFRTGAGLPDTAVVTAVRLTFRRQLIKGGSDPIIPHQGIMVDIKKGTYGTAALELGDFQAVGVSTVYRTFGPIKPAGNTVGWYTLALPAAAGSYVNKLGLTQIRLRFLLDDDNNFRANYLSIFSGDAPAGSQPQLIVQYYVP